MPGWGYLIIGVVIGACLATLCFCLLSTTSEAGRREEKLEAILNREAPPARGQSSKYFSPPSDRLRLL
jgi:hypothetical protein